MAFDRVCHTGGHGSEASEYPLFHHGRLGHGTCRHLRLPLGQDAEFRPGRPRGPALHECLHADRQVRAVAFDDHDGALPLAARRGREPPVHLPAGIRYLPRGVNGGWLLLRDDGQGLGPGQHARRPRQAARLRRQDLQPGQGQAADLRDHEQRLRDEFRELPAGHAPRPALVLLGGTDRTAPRLRGGHGRPSGRKATVGRGPGPRLLARQRDGPP